MVGQRPHVCVITTVHTPYDGRILFKEGASLASRYDVTLLCFANGEPETREGVTIKPLGKPSGRLARVLASRRMLRAAVAERADIYHFHDPEFLRAALRLAKRTQKPVIYDVHENYPVTFDQKTYLPRWLRPIAAAVVDRLERFIAPRLAGIVVADEDLKERFSAIVASAKHEAPAQVALVRNFPPLAAMPAVNFDYPRKPWAVYVGLISEARGATKLLEAFALVHREMPDACLVLIGQMLLDRQQYASFVERYGLARAIDERGFVPYAEAMETVARCRVGVSPMPRHEKFRLNLASKVFDYMGAGVPYVASDWGATAETVKGEGGTLVYTEDPEAVARAMLAYLRDDELARATGRAGRSAVEREFNWKRQEAELLSLYERLLGKAGAATPTSRLRPRSAASPAAPG